MKAENARRAATLVQARDDLSALAAALNCRAVKPTSAFGERHAMMINVGHYNESGGDAIASVEIDPPTARALIEPLRELIEGELRGMGVEL